MSASAGKTCISESLAVVTRDDSTRSSSAATIPVKNGIIADDNKQHAHHRAIL
jgi:hypothetical protein